MYVTGGYEVGGCIRVRRFEDRASWRDFPNKKKVMFLPVP